MYKLEPVITEFDIKLPNCMFQTNSFGIVANNTDTMAQDSKQAKAIKKSTTSTNPTLNGVNASQSTPSPCALDLDVLSAQIESIVKRSSDTGNVVLRQDKVLQQLNDLKKQLAVMRASLNICQKGPQHTGKGATAAAEEPEEPLCDIVINAHPNFIPYALLGLKNAWKDLFAINVRAFTHSSIPNIGKDAQKFQEKLEQKHAGSETKRKINVTLIWKNCEHTEMISSPTMYVPIYGEINIIRYLGRVGPLEYRYENSPDCNDTDAVLDICYQLLRCTTSKDRFALLGALTKRLKKQTFFGGDHLSVADIGVHSSLKRMPMIAKKDLSPTLSAWCKRAEAITLL